MPGVKVAQYFCPKKKFAVKSNICQKMKVKIFSD